MVNVWQSLPKPIFCLAPMFGATDSAFRQLIAEIGKPDLMMTEFANVQALYSHDNTAIQQLTYSVKEQPLIAQIWGQDPELFEMAADLLVGAGFAGIDINMGCPEKAVVKKGTGAALIDNPELAGKIIQAVIRGAAGRIPVSVKTRIGNRIIRTEPWVKFLLGFDLAAISIHGRTAKAMSDGPVHWDELVKAVKLRNKLKSKALMIVNGDLFTRDEAVNKIKLTGSDGAMIGRGVFRDPYVFNPAKTIKDKTKEQKLDLLRRHLEIYETTWGGSKPFHPLKRFFKIYVNGFKGALALRIKLMTTDSVAEARDIIDK
jgi:tRNA-dihydrouridine synthase